MSCKRNSQFFNVYISKILKSISTEAEICKNSREQLNILLQILTDKIINIVYLLMKNGNKKTITWKTIKSSINIFLSGELKNNSVQIATNVINGKYNLILPPHIFNKYLHQNKYRVSKKSVLYLTAVLEYLLGEILDLAFTYTKYQKKKRITLENLQQSLLEDIEFSPILLKYNISFVNDLHIKHTKIKELVLPFRSVKKLVKHILNKKISENGLRILQYFLEIFLLNIFQNAQKISYHSNRSKINSTDIELYCKLNTISIEKNIQKETTEINNNEVIIDFESDISLLHKHTIIIPDKTGEISDIENII